MRFLFRTLSKRRHGPVVSVTTYRDNGFLASAYINFLCLLEWSPKDNREQMTPAASRCKEDGNRVVQMDQIRPTAVPG